MYTKQRAFAWKSLEHFLEKIERERERERERVLKLDFFVIF